MKKTLKLFLILTLLLLTIPALLLKSPIIQNPLKKLCEDSLSEALEMPVTIERLSGIPPFFISLEDVRIGDKESPKITISSLACIPEWYQALTGKISFLSLSLGTVAVHDSSFPATASNSQIPIIIRHLSLDRLVLKNQSLSIAGSVAFYPDRCVASITGRFWTIPDSTPIHFALDTDGAFEKLPFSLETSLHDKFRCSLSGTASTNSPFIVQEAKVSGTVYKMNPLNKIELSGSLKEDPQGLQLSLDHIKTYLNKPLMPHKKLTTDELSSANLQQIILEQESYVFDSSIDALLTKEMQLKGKMEIDNHAIPFTANFGDTGFSLNSKGSLNSDSLNGIWTFSFTPSHFDLIGAIHHTHYGQATINGSYSDKNLALKCHAQNVNLFKFHEKELTISCKTEETGLSFLVNGEGDLTLNAQGSYQDKSHEEVLTFSSLSLGTLILEKPLQASWTKTSCIVSPFTLRNNSSSLLTGQFSRQDDTIEGELRGVDLPFTKIGISHFVPIEGSHSFILGLSGTTLHPLGMVTGTAKTTLKSFDEVRLSLVTDYECTINGYRADIKSTTKGETFDKPCTLALTVTPTSIKGAITGDIDLAIVSSAFFPEELQCKGRASLTLALQGSSFSGKIDVSKGEFEIPAIGGRIKDIEINGTIQERKILITAARGHDDQGGSFTATGEIDFSQDKVVSKFEFHPQKLELVNMDLGKVFASGNLNLKGSDSNINLQGSFTIDDALLDLRANFTQDIALLEVAFKDEEALLQNTPLDFSFDITIPNTGRIEGRGLTSLWTGQLNISGNSNSYLANGSLSCTSGTFRLAGHDLKIIHGEILFKGDILNDSNINLSSSMNLPQIAVQANVTGSLDKPIVSFQSNPPMSEKEIISWVLFNKGIQDVSPLESLQLAQVLISLQKGESAFSMIDTLRSVVGIDRLDVKNDTDSNDVSVQVGKYISDTVMVTASKQISSDVNRVGLSVDVTSQLKAEAEVGDDAEGIASLTWKQDY